MKLPIRLLVMAFTTLPVILFTQTSDAALRNPFKPALPLEIIKPPEPPKVDPIKTTPPPKQYRKPAAQTKPYTNERRNTQTTRPTPPPAPPEPVVFPSVKISGVIWNTDKPQAIINDTVVSEGEVIQGMTIESISETEIKLLYKSVRRALAL